YIRCRVIVAMILVLLCVREPFVRFCSYRWGSPSHSRRACSLAFLCVDNDAQGISDALQNAGEYVNFVSTFGKGIGGEIGPAVVLAQMNIAMVLQYIWQENQDF
ncbi:MAG: hypothetical protein ACR2OU_13760, partial [Thermomicrobiales bacterium]